MRTLAFLLMLALPALAQAQVVTAAKTIRANTILTAADLALNRNISGPGIRELADAVGKETRVIVYAGRPIRAEDLAEPALVERNEIVPIFFAAGGLSMATVARALDRGAEGETVRVMNMASRKTLFGTVEADGSVKVTLP